MMESTIIGERAEFERRRNCAHCGQRLLHTQYTVESIQVFTKRCPQAREPHDFIEHRHAYPYRNRRGQVSTGTKRQMFGPDDPWNFLVDDSGFEDDDR
jgi:hypothetical protein